MRHSQVWTSKGGCFAKGPTEAMCLTERSLIIF
jgi:hypothetical protein